jgi:diguanylate cyclase (GGDEF)-like protein
MRIARAAQLRWGLAAAIVFLHGGAFAATCPDVGVRAAHRQAVEATTPASTGATPDAVEAAHRTWQALADEAAACGDAPDARAALLADWAEAARGFGDSDAVFRIEEARRRLATEHGLSRHRGDAALRLGTTLVARGEVDAAREYLDEAIAAYAGDPDLERLASAHSEKSRLERRIGDYLSALREELAALALLERMPASRTRSRSLLNLAVLYEQIELFDESRRRYADALAEAERLQDEAAVADALNGFAGFLNDFGAADAPQALAMAERALDINRRVGNRSRIGSCLLQVGRAQLNLGRLDEAAVAFDAAMAMADESDSPALRAHVQFRRGELALQRGDLTGALDLITRAREAYETQGNRHRLVKVHALLEELHRQRGDELQALRSGREHYRLRNELLGAGATGRLGELLSGFLLAEERERNAELSQANALNAERLQHERRLRTSTIGLAAAIGLALLMLAWRHVSTRRLNTLLSERTREVEAQRVLLAQANAELTEYSRDLLERSRIDPLTGLASRSHGMQRLAERLAGRPEDAGRWVLLMIDIDHFKAINDRHGHPVGDQVLVAVAGALRQGLPDDAELARIGGEEFMATVRDLPDGRGAEVAEAMCRRVRALQLEPGGVRTPVSISIGLLVVERGGATSVRDILVRADRALYAAKRDGRDCVRVATHASP